MLDDARLKAWRDALVAGELPSPARADRWQVLRAGVVNLWEFEVTEYWYADGWVQLTGGNETGKSSLMALTTLIPWLADVASNNIDTLGRSGKTFRYYVEPTGRNADRREATASTHQGWLWVEYGRRAESGDEFFTTLLFAEARSAAADMRLSWCTLAGRDRVRGGCDLLASRRVVSPKEVSAEGFVRHPSAAAYRAEVASRLLGSTAEKLEAVGKLLRVTRTPKLGEQLQVRFISDRLHDALPELDRSEINQLADGWDQLMRSVLTWTVSWLQWRWWRGSLPGPGIPGSGRSSNVPPSVARTPSPHSATSPADRRRPGSNLATSIRTGQRWRRNAGPSNWRVSKPGWPPMNCRSPPVIRRRRAGWHG